MDNLFNGKGRCCWLGTHGAGICIITYEFGTLDERNNRITANNFIKNTSHNESGDGAHLIK